MTPQKIFRIYFIATIQLSLFNVITILSEIITKFISTTIKSEAYRGDL